MNLARLFVATLSVLFGSNASFICSIDLSSPKKVIPRSGRVESNHGDLIPCQIKADERIAPISASNLFHENL